jgi:mRNA interferase HigB
MMELLNAVALSKGWRKHPQTKTWLENWSLVVRHSAWQSIINVRRAFPSADGVRAGRGATAYTITIFNVGGNDYRLLTVINYRQQQVAVISLLTHAEYSKEKWK